jgi:hypothetical protein
MITIWQDESGDLGFDLSKLGTSRHFLITFLIAKDTKPVIKVVKKVFAELSKSDRRHTHGVLHAINEKQSTREKLLRRLHKKDVTFACLHLDKSRLSVGENPHILYASMVNTLLNKVINDKLVEDSEITLLISQLETSRHLNEQLLSFVGLDSKSFDLNVDTATPSMDKGLQAVDFVSWAANRLFEYGESDLFDILSEKFTVYEYI